MTRESRKQLEERLASALTENSKLSNKYSYASIKLDALGYDYEERPLSFTTHNGETTEPHWVLSEGAAAEQRAKAEAAAAQHEKDIAAAIENTRRDTLTAVIDALGIKGYANGGYLVIGRPFQATTHDTDRFWSDLQTALAVRVEKKTADERAAIARRVKDLTRPTLIGGIAPLTPAEMPRFDHVTISGDAISAAMARPDGKDRSAPGPQGPPGAQGPAGPSGLVALAPESIEHLAKALRAETKPAKKKGGQK